MSSTCTFSKRRGATSRFGCGGRTASWSGGSGGVVPSSVASTSEDCIGSSALETASGESNFASTSVRSSKRTVPGGGGFGSRISIGRRGVTWRDGWK